MVLPELGALTLSNPYVIAGIAVAVIAIGAVVYLLWKEGKLPF